MPKSTVRPGLQSDGELVQAVENTMVTKAATEVMIFEAPEGALLSEADLTALMPDNPSCGIDPATTAGATTMFAGDKGMTDEMPDDLPAG